MTIQIIVLIMAAAAVALWPLLILSERRAARQRVCNLERYGSASEFPTVYVRGVDRKLHAGKLVSSDPVSVYFDYTVLGVHPGHIERLSRDDVYAADGSQWFGGQNETEVGNHC